MATNAYKKPRKQDDPVEVKIVLGILRGIITLVTFPFRGKGGSGAPAKRRAQALNTQEVAQRWADIQTSIGLGGATHFGSAIVSADKLLDYVLKQKGYAGETMGERLKEAREDVSEGVYHNAWQAHRLRNQLVHEVGHQVMSYEAKDAIKAYESILRELGGLR